MKVINLIVGVFFSAGIPLGLLKLAILYSDKYNKQDKENL